MNLKMTGAVSSPEGFVDDETAFILTLAASPDDFTAHLVYADWLQERDDPGCDCLRVWVDLVQEPYDDATYRHLLVMMDQFRAALRRSDPDWVVLLAEARPWVGARLATVAARLHLRVRHGRKFDRQWVDPPIPSFVNGGWNVAYYRNELDRSARHHWRKRRSLRVNHVTAEVEEPGNFMVGRPPDSVG